MITRNYFFALTILFTILSGCKEESKKTDETDKNPPPVNQPVLPEKGKVYDLKEALSLNFIEVQGEGMGTYRQIKVHIKNITAEEIQLHIPAGLYFINPDSASQSLITAISLPDLTLMPSKENTQVLPSYCTNASQHIPGTLTGWKFSHNYSGGLDEAIEFYGNYQTGIDGWLQKKNPEKFATDDSRRLFFQVVIWYHEGSNYAQISNMLSKDVFGNDIKKAKQWLDEINKEAKQLAEIIKYKNTEEIKKWIKERLSDLFKNNETLQKGKKQLNDLMQNF
jgi:hypothetical protein